MMSDNEHINTMVDKVGDGDLAAANAAFDNAVKDKVGAHIANYKASIAQNSFTPPEPTPGQDTGITGDPAELETEEDE